jgi:integration host factor subunit beta
MNRSDLIEALAARTDIPHHAAEQVVLTVFGAMAETLVSGGNIEIRGFGSFSLREYGGHTGRNPKSGEHIEVKPKKLPFFKTGKDLKERILGS